ncbi:MAG: flagellar hook-basal body complex protein [Candidatus Eremiobacteraeota bacterium]|nr:flagellar hook-basal body complex protein [Candidatus Eremiobacteraeota bacterium]
MPFDPLSVGVTGLDAYNDELGVLANNIANVGTVGFKGQNITFQDLIYQTTAFATAPTQTRGGTNPVNDGLGVKTASIDTNFSQGGLQTTGINTDLAINGDGFFILKNTDGTGVPAYTRDGHFSLNEHGVLYDPTTGLAVAGYMANNGVVTPGGVPGTIQIPIGLQNEAVGTGFGVKTGPQNDAEFDANFGGDLNQTLYLQASTPGAVPQSVTISTTIYDSLGNSHLVNVTYTPYTVGEAGVAGPGVNPTAQQVNNSLGVATSVGTEWQWTITNANPLTDPTVIPTTATGFIFFDQNGQYINTSGNANGQANTHASGSAPSTAQGNLLNITNWGTPGNNATPTSAAVPAAIGLDFSQMSSLAGTSTATTEAQNGYGQGTLSNISIGQDGSITGSFTNGQQKVLAQVTLATFQNEQGLTRIGNNEFNATANSGLPQLGQGGSGRFGVIIAGNLEESNVDLADQFTKMIIAQDAFTANSKTIQTADQDLQTVIGLKR